MPKHDYIHSRWRDLAESSGDAIAHEDQSLDSGAEGPAEPDKLEEPFHQSGKSSIPMTLRPHGHHHERERTHLVLLVVWKSLELMQVLCCLFMSRHWWFSMCRISNNIAKGKGTVGFQFFFLVIHTLLQAI